MKPQTWDLAFEAAAFTAFSVPVRSQNNGDVWAAPVSTLTVLQGSIVSLLLHIPGRALCPLVLLEAMRAEFLPLWSKTVARINEQVSQHIWASPCESRWGMTVHRHTSRTSVSHTWLKIEQINKEMCTTHTIHVYYPCHNLLFWTVSCCLSSGALQLTTSKRKKTKSSERLIFLVWSI